MNNKNIDFDLRISDKNFALIGVKHLYTSNYSFKESASKKLTSKISELKKKVGLAGIVIYSQDANMSFGYSLNEVSNLKNSKQINRFFSSHYLLCKAIQDSIVPTFTYINGRCLGFGMEIALSCDFIISDNTNETLLSLNQIRYGLIPFDITILHLIKKVGLQSACDMILTGRKINWQKGFKIGLINHLFPLKLFQHQKLKTDFLELVSKRESSTSLISSMRIDTIPIGRKIILNRARELIDKKTNGQFPASYKALDEIDQVGDTFRLNDQFSRFDIISELLQTKQSQSLIHIYNIYLENKTSLCTLVNDSKSVVTLVGESSIIPHIATLILIKNLTVHIIESNADSIKRNTREIYNYFQKKIDQRKITRDQFDLYKARIHHIPILRPYRHSHLYMIFSCHESILSDFLKHQNNLENKIVHIESQNQLPNQSNFLVLPNFNKKGCILEIDKSCKINKQGMQTLKKVFPNQIPENTDLGFYSLNLLQAMHLEALSLLSEGNCNIYIDDCMKEFGFFKGVFEMTRETFNRLSIDSLKKIKADNNESARNFQQLMELNNSTSKQEIHKHTLRQDKSKFAIKKSDDLSSSSHLKSTPVDLVIDRCLLMLIKEATICLERGIISTAAHGDLAAVFNLGFPTFWGGPFKYVDLIGIKNFLEMLSELEKNHGPRFKPSNLLVKMGKENSKFFPNENSSLFTS